MLNAKYPNKEKESERGYVEQSTEHYLSQGKVIQLFPIGYGVLLPDTFLLEEEE